MRTRRFFHVSAIVFSSLASLMSQGHAKGAVEKKFSKKNGGSISRTHNEGGLRSSHDSSDPPPRIDAALMASAERSTPSFSTLNRVTSTPSTVREEAATRYPWRNQIVTTTFWVGETPTKNNPVPNHISSWDSKWAKNYGGFDDPRKEKRANYIPTAFTPGQNPFYVALPYNDIQMGGHKPEASKVIPWFQEEFKSKTKSVCKGRWLAIRFKDKVCYAQWEDCGPFRTDHWEYVFGNERPKPNLNRGAGLDVSPAVRDFLGMNDTDVTDWRFVEFDEIPQGPWAWYGENNTFVMNRAGTDNFAEEGSRTSGNGARTSVAAPQLRM